MAALLCGETSHHGAPEANSRVSQERPEEDGGHWYFSRKELEENSPSRRDGIDLKRETYLRKSYCTFLQDLGMRLKVPQVTIATSIIFCHRFFLRQSHAKNDRRTIATVCMFLAGKVEETPRPLKDVIVVSYEIINKKDAAAAQRIKQKEVYEQQKELILVGERLVLGTLGFDFNVHHPYKPLVEAIKKFKVAQNALAQVAWNFVNDGLRTSLCLQFKPHHIAAGAIFLAAKFLKVKLPYEGEKVWWQEFDVTPRQLEEVSNQMLELYEQNRMPQSRANEAEGSAGASQCAPSKAPTHEEHVTSSRPAASSKPPPSRPNHDHPRRDNHSEPSRNIQSRTNDNGSSEITSAQDFTGDDAVNNFQEVTHNSGEKQNKNNEEDDQEGSSGKNETRDNNIDIELKDKNHDKNLAPHDCTKKLDREKLKAAFERRKAARRDVIHKIDPVDELERELEDVEVPSESDKIKPDRKQIGPQHSNGAQLSSNGGDDFDVVEEGEFEPLEDADRRYQSPGSSSRKRKPASPLEGKQRADYGSGSQKQNHHGYPDDRNGYLERDHKRHLQENHV